MLTLFLLLMVTTTLEDGDPCINTYCRTLGTPIPNMVNAMLGYDPLRGNRLIPNQPDPGMRKQIFEPTYTNDKSELRVSPNIDFYKNDKCQSNSLTSIVNNFHQYKLKKISHNNALEDSQETSTYSIPFFSLFANYEKTKHIHSFSSTSSDFKKETTFFANTSGEIYFTEINCEIYVVDISHFAKPIFKPAFIAAMRAFYKAAIFPTEEFKDVAREFINDYGTHYQSMSFLGASLTAETRFERTSIGSDSRQSRLDCVKKAYEEAMKHGVSVNKVDLNAKVKEGPGEIGASTTTGGWGDESGNTYRRESEKCLESQNDNSFSSNQLLETTSVTIHGPPPMQDYSQWALKVQEEPTVVGFKLKPIKDLFTNNFIGSILVNENDASEGYLNHTIMHDAFDIAVKNYCYIFLGGQCEEAKGCGVFSNCTYPTDICLNDDSPLGFKCVNEPVDGGWSSWTDRTGCSKTCGYRGTKTRTRSCNNPVPTRGGKPCRGQDYSIVSCNRRSCPLQPKDLGTCSYSVSFWEFACTNDSNDCANGAKVTPYTTWAKCCCKCVKDGVEGESTC